MPIDYHTASFILQYPAEQGDFRRLSIVTKAVAGYLRNCVDPVHGWLRLHGDSVAEAFRAQCAGMASQSDRRLLKRCIDELLAEGYLARCRVLEDDAGSMATHDHREVVLSGWVEDPGGDWVVVANWVPAQNRLTREDTEAWHAARRERVASTLRPAVAMMRG